MKNRIPKDTVIFFKFYFLFLFSSILQMSPYITGNVTRNYLDFALLVIFEPYVHRSDYMAVMLVSIGLFLFSLLLIILIRPGNNI